MASSSSSNFVAIPQNTFPEGARYEGGKLQPIDWIVSRHMTAMVEASGITICVSGDVTMQDQMAFENFAETHEEGDNGWTLCYVKEEELLILQVYRSTLLWENAGEKDVLELLGTIYQDIDMCNMSFSKVEQRNRFRTSFSIIKSQQAPANLESIKASLTGKDWIVAPNVYVSNSAE